MNELVFFEIPKQNLKIQIVKTALILDLKTSNGPDRVHISIL